MKKTIVLLLFTTFISILYAELPNVDSIEKYDIMYQNREYQKIINDIGEIKNNYSYLELYYLGISYFQLEKDNIAQDYLQKSIELKPNYFKSHDYLAISYFYTNNFSDALTEYTICTQLDPLYIRGFYMMGLCFEGLNDIENEIEYLHKALEINENHLDSIYRLGLIYFDNNEYLKSKVFLESYIKLNQENYSTYSMLIQINNSLNDYTNVSSYKEIIRQIHNSTTNESIRNINYFQIENLKYNDFKITFLEKFDCTGDLYYFWIANIYDKSGTFLKSINLESSSVIRELGTPYIIGSDTYTADKRIHNTSNIEFNELPEFEEFKSIVLSNFTNEFTSTATGIYNK